CPDWTRRVSGHCCCPNRTSSSKFRLTAFACRRRNRRGHHILWFHQICACAIWTPRTGNQRTARRKNANLDFIFTPSSQSPRSVQNLFRTLPGRGLANSGGEILSSVLLSL